MPETPEKYGDSGRRKIPLQSHGIVQASGVYTQQMQGLQGERLYSRKLMLKELEELENQ